MPPHTGPAASRLLLTLLGVVLVLAHAAPSRAADPPPASSPGAAAPAPASAADAPAEAAPAAQDEEFSAHGFNTLRIEQEDKIWVPMEHEEEVWSFLHAGFVTERDLLRSLDPTLTAYFNEEHFADTYYDTPSFQLYARESGVRHRRRVNITNPEDRKSGRQLMQIKVNNVSSNALERGEIKFEIKHPTSIKTAEDAHPMIGIVRPSQREDFKAQLVKLGLDPFAMRPVLTVVDVRRRIYLQRAGKTLMSISFDHARSSLLWANVEFVEIEPELNEIVFTEASPAERKELEALNAQVSGLIRTRFPFTSRNLTPKYNKSFDLLAARIPLLRRLVAHNLHNANAVAGIAGLVLLLLALPVVAAWRRLRAPAAGRAAAGAPVPYGTAPPARE